MSSDDDQHIREAKVANSELAYYNDVESPTGSSTGDPINIQGPAGTTGVVGVSAAAITLPTSVSWTQADLEHAAMSGEY